MPLFAVHLLSNGENPFRYFLLLFILVCVCAHVHVHMYVWVRVCVCVCTCGAHKLMPIFSLIALHLMY